MSSFTDVSGRKWDVVIDISTVKRVRSSLDINLLDVVGGKVMEQLISDPILLCDTIYVVCKSEADAKDISDEDFGRGLSGDVIEHATTAFLEALTEFFPLARRHLLQKAIGKWKTMEEKVLDLASKKLDDPSLMKNLEKDFGDLFGSSPESPESIQTP